MTRLNGLRSVCVALCLGGPGVVAAQADDADAGGFARTLELPAHQALSTVRNQTLAPFETDGCSGGLSEVWRLVADQFPEFSAVHEQVPPWESCCVIHDRAYHDGGGTADPEASFAARLTADRALAACVVEVGQDRNAEMAKTYNASPAQVTGAYDTISGAMYLAVRFGGAPCSGLPWRWGFGYPGCSILQGKAD